MREKNPNFNQQQPLLTNGNQQNGLLGATHVSALSGHRQLGYVVALQCWPPSPHASAE